MTNHTPVLPSEPEIERVVLGAILLNESSAQVEQARRRLRAADFTVPSNRQIFECLCEMLARGDAINPIVLQARLRATGANVDAVTIAALLDGIPHRSDLSTEIRILQEVATRREIMRCANAWTMEAEARDVDVESLVRAMTSRVAEFGRAGVAPAKPIALSWAELCELKIERGETILHEVERGEIVMSPAITNRGKTTLWRNVALSLASGREFLPLTTGGKPRSVLYLDFETRLWRARSDLNKMLGQLSQSERALVSQNFHLVCDCRIEERPLTLSNSHHTEILEAEARRCKADVLIVDTLTAAFEIEHENDNAEAARVMKKLTGLAQRLNCVVVFLHHIGKAKQEEGQTAHIVHRGRGGSAYSGFSHGIFNLTADPILRERVTLECAKVKGERFEDTVLTLDQATRWFVAGGVAAKPLTPYEQVVGAFNGAPLKRAALRDLLPSFGASTLDRYLKDAVKAGDLVEIGRGTYQKPPSPQSPHPYRGEDFEDLGESSENIEVKPDFQGPREIHREDFDCTNAAPSQVAEREEWAI